MTNRVDPADDLRLEFECTRPVDFTPEYHLADQTLIFFDWDDTLFPTTEFFEQWGLHHASADLGTYLSHEQEEDLQEWRDALFELLLKSCMLASKCIILTNSRRPWVKDCIERFAPKVMLLFDECEGLEIVYATEHASETFRQEARGIVSPSQPRCGIATGVQPCMWTVDLEEEWVLEQTFTKRVAMNKKVTEFYSKYAGQTWKNVLSFGDMPFEYHAIQDVTFHHTAPKGKQENVRTKCFLLPSKPKLSELALRLRFHAKVSEVYVTYDGDLRLDLTAEENPLDAIANAVGVPELSPCEPCSPLSFTSPLSSHQWGIGPRPMRGEIQNELEKVEEIVSMIVSL